MIFRKNKEAPDITHSDISYQAEIFKKLALKENLSIAKKIL